MNHRDLTVEQAVRIWAVEQATALHSMYSLPSRAPEITSSARTFELFVLEGAVLPDPLIKSRSNLNDESQEIFSGDISVCGAEVLSLGQCDILHNLIDDRFAGSIAHNTTPVSGLDTETVANAAAGEQPAAAEG